MFWNADDNHGLATFLARKTNIGEKRVEKTLNLGV